ncbi:hypothetical protein CLAFUW4_14229 [Fulvia fulva]|uniref:Uncharacterized protein n=1 Tax=Passalora fulva TaxID=5499 RepID=A0A9Q8UWZ1_PASFU|nr:uncharacterized protein CLAFUR5_14062 [Fulvia fulva]KAK4609007.1 hypothetical protein CLAFUR4_14232 [Fulvia fulva]KAK4609509.1 hypothetical protein CLAFUR0_14237 [Fulvia fulva]UJO25347.1 hypothetical protein CLAFUR5_14062 [Fulvia fulva]WPV22421.1 hypothetical protein CLAFUW4_14229 [Fulvia fulva]WPV37891.1 hypothetical protein CLAFUW7_14240 [Fulvia fulva]
MAESPFFYYDDDFWKAEWRVNGAWNSIISAYFPHGINSFDWIVAPEAYPTWDETQSKAADLMVAAIESDDGALPLKLSTPVLTYEGKGSTSAQGFDKIAQQILVWCQRGVLFGSPFYSAFCCWAVGTHGKLAKFYAFDGQNLVPIGCGRDAHGGLEVKRMAGDFQDITTLAGWQYVDFMLSKVQANPHITAQEIANLPV